MYFEDTIGAISTPQGEGGIGIVRVSGSQAHEIGLRLFCFHKGSAFSSHFLHYGTVVDPRTNMVLDKAMAVLMKAPRSYTREDVLEIHCHGGPLVVEQVLAAVLYSGARLADAGEFTRRAFLNGRIDLLEAEAVMDIISSRSAASLDFARRQQGGVLSCRMSELKSLLIHSLALVEAYIDFPEDDLGAADTILIKDYAGRALISIAALLGGFNEGRIIRDGVAVLIAGKPNVGKSSLLNRLLGEERAIVTHIPGTTRDIIEETANIGGLILRLLDTAGIRHTDDPVEQAGINRALESLPMADLVLFVLDASRPIDNEDINILEALVGRRILLVCNKSDLADIAELPVEMSSLPICSVSATKGDGIDQLKAAIRNSFFRDGIFNSNEFVAISRIRHRDAILSAEMHLSRFMEGLKSGRELETLAIDLRDALCAIGQITGETSTDDILDSIFSSFCIGK